MDLEVFRNTDQQLTWAGGSLPVQVRAVEATTTSARRSEELAVLDVRHALFGEVQPSGVFGFGNAFGEAMESLPPQDLPTAVLQAVLSLLVPRHWGRRAAAHCHAQFSPPGPEGRRVRPSWTPPVTGRSRGRAAGYRGRFAAGVTQHRVGM
jgi:hypothetical protein